jgi:hypothetical protein
MKKLFYAGILGCTIFLAGCFETTQEITIHEDGTGVVSTTTDMSAMVNLAKQMGGGGDIDNLMNTNMDTSFSLASQADSLGAMTQNEKQMLNTGTMQVAMNMKADKFFTRLSFPFKNTNEIAAYNRLSSKVFGSKLKELMASSPQAAQLGGAELPAISSFDDYYDLNCSNGEIKRSINKERYATAENDEYLKGMKETGSMGIPVTATYVINLPRPATKVEAKDAVISEDKKKITIKVDIDDFFDHPEKLEYKIKY